MGKYLPSRYPGIFKLHPNTDNSSEIFENTVTGASWPTTLHAETPTTRALEILAQTVDEEFLILLPDVSSPDQPKYMLQAYATCFPSGFNTREKLGLRLADIHTPVPGYANKLERSMDRFFAKVEVGRFVKRVNWSVTTETELFAAFGSVHGSHVPEDKPEEERALRLEELNIDQVCSPLSLRNTVLIEFRRFCAVSARLCIDCRSLRRLFLLFTRIPTPYGKLRMRGLERIWLLLLMA